MNELGMSCLAFVACDISDEIHPLNQIVSFANKIFIIHSPFPCLSGDSEEKRSQESEPSGRGDVANR